jgi:hypothetical protein
MNAPNKRRIIVRRAQKRRDAFIVAFNDAFFDVAIGLLVAAAAVWLCKTGRQNCYRHALVMHPTSMTVRRQRQLQRRPLPPPELARLNCLALLLDSATALITAGRTLALLLGARFSRQDRQVQFLSVPNDRETGADADLFAD